jgi:hypothetical protein
MVGELNQSSISIDNHSAPEKNDRSSSASSGDAESQYQLGEHYFGIGGVEENKELAFMWYHRAAEQGHAEAQIDLGLMYANGEGVRTSRDTLSNAAMREQVEDATASVREGMSLARALAVHPHFPPMLIHMIRAGEVTGELPVMLNRAAQMQEQDLERRALTIASLLEPVLILTMGVVVLMIVLAVLMPIIEINQLVK